MPHFNFSVLNVKVVWTSHSLSLCFLLKSKKKKVSNSFQTIKVSFVIIAC